MYVNKDAHGVNSPLHEWNSDLSVADRWPSRKHSTSRDKQPSGSLDTTRKCPIEADLSLMFRVSTLMTLVIFSEDCHQKGKSSWNICKFWPLRWPAQMTSKKVVNKFDLVPAIEWWQQQKPWREEMKPKASCYHSWMIAACFCTHPKITFDSPGLPANRLTWNKGSFRNKMMMTFKTLTQVENVDATRHWNGCLAHFLVGQLIQSCTL